MRAVSAVCAGELGLTPLLARIWHAGCEANTSALNEPPVHYNQPSEGSDVH